MLDLGISKMALIGAVALIVIGPEKLPRVARTVGTLLGKAQRYVSDVTAGLEGAGSSSAGSPTPSTWEPPPPEYRRPNKNWRLKRGATPQWYKARHGVRRQVQSGAARVARYRPKPK